MYSLEIKTAKKLFFTSDTHFAHFRICHYCNRPFKSGSDMNNALIRNWNSVVPEDGIVICCGDFMLPHDTGYKEYAKYIAQLNGTIYLTRGNHDKIDIGEYFLKGKNTPKLIVNDMRMINVKGTKIFAQHYPCLTFNGEYQVYGHVHTLFDGTINGLDKDAMLKRKWNQYDVGVDQNKYKPVSYKELINIFNKNKGN